MSTNPQIPDERLLAHFHEKDVPVTIADLKDYVSSTPAPKRRSSYYAATAIVVLLIGAGMLLQNRPNPTAIVSLKSDTHEQTMVAAATQQLATQVYQHTTQVQPRRSKQRPRNARSMIGVNERPPMPYPTQGYAQRVVIECNDPSFLVALSDVRIPGVENYVD
jgi:hypothetical protein